MIRGRRRPDLVPEPSESGWPALYRTVRESDINKVDDCREDIDTLLVFAGLYSAALTAFVIESYTQLKQDPQDVIIGLLQQIATQNFSSGPGFINSTTASTLPPPFEPPLWAVRVNVLWFTSLLLSLSSASFGILVKQWLREYLAIGYAAPRERLRARQYRYPAMEDWKVFEIAAFLPLLLQLSLGLFFIGLCFFTAAIHTSIRRTTTPLVCAWLFLLIVTTIAPLFSPRCPFKTTFLKAGLRAGRCYITPLLVPPWRLVGQLIFTSLFTLPLRFMARLSLRGRSYFAAGWKYIVEGAHIEEGLFRIFKALADVAISIPWYWADMFFRVVCCIALSPVLLPVLAWSRPESPIRHISRQLIGYTLLRFMQHVKKPFAIWEQNTREAPSHEEEEVIKTEEEDTGVLLSVDSLVSDDGLLPAMLDAIRQQAGASSEKVVEFILKMIGRRIGGDLGTGRLEAIPDLRPLSKLAWSTLIDAIVDILQGRAPLEISSPDWVFNSVVAVLSPSRFELSDAAVEVTRKLLPRTQRAPDHQCTVGKTVVQRFTEENPALKNYDLAQRFLRLRAQDTAICLRCIMDTCTSLLCQDPVHWHPSLRHLLDSHTGGDMWAAFPRALILDLFNILVSFLLRTISSQKNTAEIPGSHEALHIILQYGNKFGRRDDAVKLCRQMLPTESGTRMLQVHFAALHPQCRVSEDTREILRAVPTSPEDYDRIGSHLAAACERFCNGGDDGDDDVPLDYVRLCAAFIRWIGDDYQTARAVAKAIEKYHRTRGWRKELQRREYWYSDAPSPTSDELFKEDQALACRVLKDWEIRSTELINVLWLFVPEERSDEILRSIREIRLHTDYAPPSRPAPSTGLDEAENGQDTAEADQEVGDAGSEGPVGMGQDAGRGDSEAVDVEAGGSADVSTVAVPWLGAAETQLAWQRWPGTSIATQDLHVLEWFVEESILAYRRGAYRAL